MLSFFLSIISTEEALIDLPKGVSIKLGKGTKLKAIDTGIDNEFHKFKTQYIQAILPKGEVVSENPKCVLEKDTVVTFSKPCSVLVTGRLIDFKDCGELAFHASGRKMESTRSFMTEFLSGMTEAKLVANSYVEFDNVRFSGKHYKSYTKFFFVKSDTEKYENAGTYEGGDSMDVIVKKARMEGHNVITLTKGVTVKTPAKCTVYADSDVSSEQQKKIIKSLGTKGNSNSSDKADEEESSEEESKGGSSKVLMWSLIGGGIGVVVVAAVTVVFTMF